MIALALLAQLVLPPPFDSPIVEPLLPAEWVQPGSGSRAPFINIKAAPYFAICNGVTPDTSAITAAVAAAGSGEVRLPPGAVCVLDATVTIPSDALCIVGEGAGSTILYTGSGDALLWPAPRRSACLRNVAIRFDSTTGATATAAHIQGASSGAFRIVFDHVSIYRGSGVDALLLPLTGQTGILIDSTGATGGWFSTFSKLWIAGIDTPISCGSTCNQNAFSDVQLEQFGSGANGYGIILAGNNNLVSGLRCSRGGSTATNLFCLNLNGGTYNLVSGTADIGVGSAWTGTLGTTNQVFVTDSSVTPLTGFFGQQIRLGATPALSGAIRLSNNTSINFRDQANGADLTGVFCDTNNRCKYGSSAAFARLDNNIIEHGTGTVANSGNERFVSSWTMLARNAANSGNVKFIDFGSTVADVATLGDATAASVNLGALTPFTNATLGTPSNGVVRFCSDCTIANPCAGGGTGAMAKRLNGVWVCN